MKDYYYAILLTIIAVVVLPLLAWGMASLVNFLKSKASEIENDKIREAVLKAIDIVEQAVLYVMQTYVDALKRKGEFDIKAQEEAFQKAKEAACILITDEMKKTIEDGYGDFDAWLETRIEQTVRATKLK
jgi:ABC-type Na+ efflux pump permease subunit